MSEVTTKQAESSMSTTEQAKERLGEGAQQIQEKASEAKARTRDQIRQQIDNRSSETGEQLTNTASALRQTAQQLRTDQREQPAKLLEQLAERTERFGRYLSETDGNQMLRDFERIGRTAAVSRGRSRHDARVPRGAVHKGVERRRYEENGNGGGRPARGSAASQGEAITVTSNELRQADLRERPVGELLKQLADETTTLVRQELELAKAEMREKASKAGPGLACGEPQEQRVCCRRRADGVPDPRARRRDAELARGADRGPRLLGDRRLLYVAEKTGRGGRLPCSAKDNRNAEGGRAMGETSDHIREDIEQTRGEWARPSRRSGTRPTSSPASRTTSPEEGRRRRQCGLARITRGGRGARRTAAQRAAPESGRLEAEPARASASRRQPSDSSPARCCLRPAWRTSASARCPTRSARRHVRPARRHSSGQRRRERSSRQRQGDGQRPERHRGQEMASSLRGKAQEVGTTSPS